MHNYWYKTNILFLFSLILVSLAGCSGGGNTAPKAIEAYIQALSQQDAAQVTTISCAEWEQNARIEVDSFTAVSSEIKDLSCEQSGQDGNDTYISCTGTINLDYNGEAQQIDLSSRTYIARQEGGEWRMCGYRSP